MTSIQQDFLQVVFSNRVLHVDRLQNVFYNFGAAVELPGFVLNRGPAQQPYGLRHTAKFSNNACEKHS